MGERGEVWDGFDKRKKKVANDSDGVVDEGVDMFEAAGVAAEYWRFVKGIDLSVSFH